MKRITVLGATGSIGQNALDLMRRNRDDYQIIALTGGHNIAQLAKDAIEFKAAFVATAFDDKLSDIKSALSGTGITCAAGADALIEAAQKPADCTISGIIGAAGLLPGLSALVQGNTVALANKESMVCAGQLFLQSAQKHGAKVLPVDSEHCAIFQTLEPQHHAAISKVTITASGGAVHDMPLDQLAHCTPQQALKHPVWDMGMRITIDSASMFNKAMEVIEAKEFFNLSPSLIDVVIHRQSIIHAMVSYKDGAVLAHMGVPDMRHAIGFALNYPDRKPLPVAPLDFPKIANLTFESPCNTRHRPLIIAERVMQQGGNWGAAFNGAKEVALDRFLEREIGFLDMTTVVENTLNEMEQNGTLANSEPDLDTVIATDGESRRAARAALV